MVSTGINKDSNPVQALLELIINVGINGLGLLPSAEKVAADYLRKSVNVEEAINSLIAWRTSYTFGTGFITGLGGIATMPITIPASLCASYVLGANTAAAIACLRGYNVRSDQVQTMVLLCLVGNAGEKILKEVGIRIGEKLCQNLIKQIPGRVLIEINKRVGFRLITKAGQTGAINLTKMIPLVGGIVGGSLDSLFVNSSGQVAKKYFA